jgi:acyl-CoA thioester hydrolase
MTAMPRHRVQVPLRWSDVDAYGHVNNVQFLRLLEEARILALSAHGTDDGGTLLSSHLVSTGLLVARSEIEYLRPLEFRVQPVSVDLWVTSVRAADFEMSYEVHDGRGGAPFAQAATVLVVYDLAHERPRRMSAEERGRLADWADAPLHWRHRRAPAR